MNNHLLSHAQNHQAAIKQMQLIPITLQQQLIGSPYKQQDELDKIEKFKKAFDGLARKSGSEQIGLPLLLPIDTFIGNDYRPLKEKLAGRLLTAPMPDGLSAAVRYEGTAPTTRFAVERLNRGVQECALHYTQSMVRLETSDELDNRHFREFTQFGYESFTKQLSSRISAFANMAGLNLHFFQQQGISATFRVSHTKLIADYLRQAGLSVFAQKRIASLMENGSIIDIQQATIQCGLTPVTQEILIELANARGIPIGDAIPLLKSIESQVGAVVDDFLQLMEALKNRGILDFCKFDPGINRSLNFYNGFSMQMDAGDVREVAGGGEYTGMPESFGCTDKVYACGSAIGVERVLQAFEKEGSAT